MTILLHKPYLLSVHERGRGGQKSQKSTQVVYGWPIGAIALKSMHEYISRVLLSFNKHINSDGLKSLYCAYVSKA